VPPVQVPLQHSSFAEHCDVDEKQPKHALASPSPRKQPNP
jgi:hypothetical protein